MLNDCEVYKKAKYMNKLGIIFKNQNYCKKFLILILMLIPKNIKLLSDYLQLLLLL